ncbi:dihydrolipoyl dehydrogenase [Candidatus Desulfovibrio trichonymphae]|uniref:Dihydrolipoyl dehydrogenase n=1 Tax=Candidatus Desulfovibrio trichonymphae TaxID=1725232 RepID=A0A1J1DTG3_9BACT|nr:dihydrolipoyl dehydrogenase [Candidatus Desulfovibrio trichonymphae]BAV91957.1 glycine cleavage system L protein [Candidatus Desulfovibrio trichonymphae]
MHDITIIGAGPGGYAAAFDAARRGASVTLVEKAELGGTCLNSGCIPTKTIKASADALETAGGLAEFGLVSNDGAHSASFRADMPSIVARKERVCKILRGGLEKTCTGLKIKLLHGQAELAPDRKVLVYTGQGVEKLCADAVIIATGSKIMTLPSLSIDHRYIIDSDDALHLEQLPTRMLIAGGGVIGCELAFIFRAFGVKVTVVEGLNRLLPLPSIDEEVSRLLQREAKKRGIRVELARIVKSAELSGSKVACILSASPFVESAGGQEEVIETDVVLVTVGRSSNTAGLKLKEAGVATDRQGWIMADGWMRTSADGVYAIGDALGPARAMLAHVASFEGECAVANCFGREERLDYSVIPSGIFTSPEIGTVGLSEAEAKKQGMAVRSSLFQFRELGKAHAMGELPGLFKLVCEESSGRILGAHIAGAHATDIIAEAALAMKSSLSVAQLANTMHAHPTLAEGLYEAAKAWLRG